MNDNWTTPTRPTPISLSLLLSDRYLILYRATHSPFTTSSSPPRASGAKLRIFISVYPTSEIIEDPYQAASVGHHFVLHGSSSWKTTSPYLELELDYPSNRRSSRYEIGFSIEVETWP
ncbi:hypothetical protein BS47DRAFT_1394908 [Hydnum rufescens UP504]|uniref:Uncharacterized protein n=1 Tax=Hydnum rufescens UP504 TaxID=1448309 RepID=A0A9P6ATA7_9AGAM|nr:hypothetical protein BS47DRAFT_1394908 [Hydnum rufescens UP504]